MLSKRISVEAWTDPEIRRHTYCITKQGQPDFAIDLGDGFIAVIKSPIVPPKRYTFADAFEMMKGGTKMKPADYNSPAYVLRNGRWYMNGDCVAKGDVIPWDYLTMDWSEATP